MDWLDTRTREILHKDPDLKSVATRTDDFALILVRKGDSTRGLVRALGRIRRWDEGACLAFAKGTMPKVVAMGLSLEEAYQGQFELIFCDSVGVLLRSEVLNGGDRNHIYSVLAKVLHSPEFKPTRIRVAAIDDSERGRAFVDQFLGAPVGGSGRPVNRFSMVVPFKKARIMRHWAGGIGAIVSIETNSEDQAKIC